MSKEFLYGTKVRSIVQKVCRKAVPDGVGADLRIQSNCSKVLGDLAANRATAKPATMLVHEEWRFR